MGRFFRAPPQEHLIASPRERDFTGAFAPTFPFCILNSEFCIFLFPLAFPAIPPYNDIVENIVEMR